MKKFLATVGIIGLVSMNVGQVLAGQVETLLFSSSISPITVNLGQTQTYTVTVTNDASSTKDVKSIIVPIPSGFTVLSTSIVSPSGWTISTSTSTTLGSFELNKTANNDLTPGNSLVFVFEATAPGTYTEAEWTVGVYLGTQGEGGSFTSSTPLPVVTVGTLTPPVTTYTLSYSAGANGSITGSSTQVVAEGGDGEAVTAVANSGFEFVNWSDETTTNPRTDTNVTGNISVTANFADSQAPVITIGSPTVNLLVGGAYTEDASALDNLDGSITGNIVITGGPVVTSAPAVFTLHYNVSDAKGNAATEVIRTVNVTEVPIVSHTISVSSGVNGSISPAGPSVTVNDGATQSFTITADSGYHVADVLVDEVSVGAVATYDFTNVTGDHTISAIFEADEVVPVVEECNASTFDTASLGSANGQDGWAVTGPFDQEIVDNTYGYADFGCKTLRISDSVTSGSFGDQLFSPSTTNEAGETDALSGEMSSGTRQSRFEAQFDIASTMSSEQSGMHISVSPDRGDGARMSYLRIEDSAEGINIFFDDVQGTDNPANFIETQVATDLSRTAKHTIKFAMDFVDGPSNDVVQIYIDGELVHTGTTWENYYRFDPESNPSLVSNSRTVDSLLFRESGAAHAGNAGNGYLIDNVMLSTSATPSVPPQVVLGSQGGAGGSNGTPGCKNPAATNYDPAAVYEGPCTFAPGQVLGAATTTGSGASNGTTTPQGEVLGAASSTAALSCGEYLSLNSGLTKRSLREGKKNDPAIVMLLQRFLNEYVPTNLPVTGFFGPLTTTAVKKLQLNNKEAILAPWKISRPTGIVYLTTVAHINNTKCADLKIKVSEADLIPAAQ